MKNRKDWFLEILNRKISQLPTAMAFMDWRSFRITCGVVSFGFICAAFFLHSRSDPCLAFEREYMKDGESCSYKMYVLSPVAMIGIWVVSLFLMGVCKFVEKVCSEGLNHGGRVKHFFCRFVLECFHTAILAVSSVLAAEVSTYVAIKGGVPAQYEMWSAVCSIISVLFLMLAVRTPEHFGVFDIVEATFISIMLALGRCNLLGLMAAAVLCFSYRMVIFFTQEIMSGCGMNLRDNRRLIIAANLCVVRSRVHLRDLEANVPEGSNDPEGPIMSQLRHLRERLNDLENAIPLRRGA